MANFASLSKSRLRVIGIGRPLEVLQVARDAGDARQVVVIVDVAIRTLPWWNCVRSCQSEVDQRVIKGCRLPCDRGVALLTSPSYSSGVWAWGRIAHNLDYIAMIANNLSTLGVSAAQLNNGFNTFSSSLVWTPTTGEFGTGFGDFEHHDKWATRLGLHFTRSDEDTQ
jgi:hypothetical protein